MRWPLPLCVVAPLFFGLKVCSGCWRAKVKAQPIMREELLHRWLLLEWHAVSGDDNRKAR
jgi:hypothetical protein